MQPSPSILQFSRIISPLFAPLAGYTGTQVCNDPEKGIIAILLTNRVYPEASDASLNEIHQFRIMFSNLILDVLGSAEPASA